MAEPIKTGAIVVGARMRAVNEARVIELADSLARLGQLQPVLCRMVDGTPRLVAGAHRLAAAGRLGWPTIAAECLTLTDSEAELVEIDENLTRAGLSPAERSRHLLRRASLLKEMKISETGTPCSSLGGRGNLGLAAIIGEQNTMSKQHANRLLAAAEAIGEQGLSDIKGTSLDKHDEIAKLAKLDAQRRGTLIRHAKEGRKVSAKSLTKRMAAKKQTERAAGTEAAREARLQEQFESVRWMIEHMEPELLDRFADWFQGWWRDQSRSAPLRLVE